jgi:hypothetical protein
MENFPLMTLLAVGRDVVKKKIILAIICILVVGLSFAENDQDLELKACINSDGTNGYLCIQITNHGEEAVTILTDNFTFLMTAGVMKVDPENIIPAHKRKLLLS